MIKTEVERIADGELTRTVWIFWFDERRGSLILDRYAEQTRASRRHKFKTDPARVFDRCNRRESQITALCTPVPRDVAEQALRDFVKSLDVTKGDHPVLRGEDVLKETEESE